LSGHSQHRDTSGAPVPRFATSAPPKSTLPAEFVVGGKGAGNVFDGNQISLASAKKIARACRDWAASKGGTMSLYIIDNAGEFVHMERMDGQVFNNIRTAMLKAQTSLRTRQPTSLNAAQLIKALHARLPERQKHVGGDPFLKAIMGGGFGTQIGMI